MRIIGYDDPLAQARGRQETPVIIKLSEKGRALLEMSRALVRGEKGFDWEIKNRHRFPGLTLDDWEFVSSMAHRRADRLRAEGE